MSLALGQIGFFQLSNLVRNKVPFTLFTLGFNPPENLTGDLKLLMAKAVATSSTDLLILIDEMKLTHGHPIVLLCDDGIASAAMSSQLAKKGFLNVYRVKNGWRGLETNSKQ